jgi:hypothetical protein
MSPVDELIDRGADRLEELSRRTSHRRIAEELRDDAEFLRKLKPSLIVERVRGEDTSGEPKPAPQTTEPRTEVNPPRRKPSKSGGLNPFVVVAATFAVGILLAKVVDWRSVAHPRY